MILHRICKIHFNVGMISTNYCLSIYVDFGIRIVDVEAKNCVHMYEYVKISDTSSRIKKKNILFIIISVSGKILINPLSVCLCFINYGANKVQI